MEKIKENYVCLRPMHAFDLIAHDKQAISPACIRQDQPLFPTQLARSVEGANHGGLRRKSGLEVVDGRSELRY
jgi:hypothetical protein